MSSHTAKLRNRGKDLILEQAVQLALQNNHDVRIASLNVEEARHAKQVTRSAYLPVLRTESTFTHVTDTQFIGISAGALGVVDGSRIPSRTVVLSQGGKTFETSGIGLVQPLTELFKVKASNDVARAEVEASKAQAHSAENQIAFKVRQLDYDILIVQSEQQGLRIFRPNEFSR